MSSSIPGAMGGLRDYTAHSLKTSADASSSERLPSTSATRPRRSSSARLHQAGAPVSRRSSGGIHHLSTLCGSLHQTANNVAASLELVLRYHAEIHPRPEIPQGHPESLAGLAPGKGAPEYDQEVEITQRIGIASGSGAVEEDPGYVRTPAIEEPLSHLGQEPVLRLELRMKLHQ